MQRHLKISVKLRLAKSTFRRLAEARDIRIARGDLNPILALTFEAGRQRRPCIHHMSGLLPGPSG